MQTLESCHWKEAREVVLLLPIGMKCEQLIANVLLAVMVSQLRSDAAAKRYIDQAYALAKALAQQSIRFGQPNDCLQRDPERRPDNGDRGSIPGGAKPGCLRWCNPFSTVSVKQP
jgi:hypothetical protein